MAGIALVFLIASAPSAVLAQGESMISVHGSGSINPSKCYWHVMDKLEASAKTPLRLTYRAIGSSGGQADF